MTVPVAGGDLPNRVRRGRLAREPPTKARRHVETAGKFSYPVPDGWQVGELPGLKYKILHRIDLDFRIDIIFADETARLSLTDYVERGPDTIAERFKGFQVIGRSSFKTDTGKNGIEVAIAQTVNGQKFRQTLYFFDRGRRKFLVTYTRTSDRGG